MGGRRSELLQPVAPLFSTPRPERQRRALPLLRQLRSLVASGKGLFEALSSLPVAVEREFARAELVRAALPICELENLDRWGDTTLRLYFVDKALRDCGALHRGGHHVTGARRAGGAA